MLSDAGLFTKLERPPAMCFLDITGYTRLTQERGDEAAAGLAEEVGRLVNRTSVEHGGRAVKWLGDGVMLYFSDPGPGVVAALDMVDGVTSAGLPPAHVGLHAGPVLFQEGDYFGQTVNLASRIAEYARPGEVLVSQAVVDAARGDSATFTRYRSGRPQGRRTVSPPARGASGHPVQLTRDRLRGAIPPTAASQASAMTRVRPFRGRCGPVARRSASLTSAATHEGAKSGHSASGARTRGC